MPALARTVADLAAGLDEQGRLWLAAALAALAEQVQLTTLPVPAGRGPAGGTAGDLRS